MKIFGRITADREICKKITQELLNVFVMCYEGVDDGCSAPHCHFVGETIKEYKNIASFRQKITKVCKEEIGKSNQYSIKLLDEEDAWLPYLCKGSKKDVSVEPEILINNINADVPGAHKQFHERAKEIKQGKHNSSVWRDFEAYLQENHTELYDNTVKSKVFLIRDRFKLVSRVLYQWIVEKQDRLFQSDTMMKNIVLTIVARASKGHPQEWKLLECVESKWVPDYFL